MISQLTEICQEWTKILGQRDTSLHEIVTAVARYPDLRHALSHVVEGELTPISIRRWLISVENYTLIDKYRFRRVGRKWCLQLTANDPLVFADIPDPSLEVRAVLEFWWARYKFQKITVNQLLKDLDALPTDDPARNIFDPIASGDPTQGYNAWRLGRWMARHVNLTSRIGDDKVLSLYRAGPMQHRTSYQVRRHFELEYEHVEYASAVI